MQVIENETFPVASTESTNQPVPQADGYAAVRFNALKHGVLSRHVVLPHEDREEFDQLREALIVEHQPTGATELHLIEELAGILWRKRRVLMAEGARINEGLRSTAQSPKSVLPSAVPFQMGLSGEYVDLPDLVTASPNEMSERHRAAELDLKATQKAAAILRKGGPNAYEKARRALLSESRDWWDEHVEQEEYPANAEGLAAFINDTLYPICTRIELEARYQPQIKAQTLGEGLQAHRLLNLNRYETHLDRKLERTLAMILKMKELRRA